MENIETAFNVSKIVFSKELSITEGANRLNRKFGININSAKIIIAVYAKMINGLEFKRALSATDMSYFLARIMSESGPQALSNPLSALWKHIEYYETKNEVTLRSLRNVHFTYLTISQGVDSFDDSSESFEKAIDIALKIPKRKREKLLAESTTIPPRKAIVVNVYERNPCVAAEVLERANGVCEKCDSPAPFKKKRNHRPYLEVHHKTRLADGGKDTIENAIALCPNCHRELHYGVLK